MAVTKVKITKSSLIDLYYTQGKTLKDIGDIYGITRERVRQLMSKHDLPRLKRHQRHPRFVVYHTLDDYFADYRKRIRDTKTMRNLLDILECSECGSKSFLVSHHLRYPATSIDDIQILCKSCHKIKHNQGMTYEKQLLLFIAYKEGASYKELMVRFGISKSLVTKLITKIKRNYRTLRGA